MPYNVFILTLIAMIATVLSTTHAADTTTALVTINNPANNQMLTPSQQVIIQYTVNGIPQAYPPKEITNYPNFLKMNLRWTSKNNTNNTPIELTALSSLNADSLAGGLKNIVYTQKWKLPNCHFFKRYLPSDWSFSLVFEPEYSDLPLITPTNNNSTKHHASTVVPLGPQQAVITVPINVSFNATLIDDAHHKGC